MVPIRPVPKYPVTPGYWVRASILESVSASRDWFSSLKINEVLKWQGRRRRFLCVLDKVATLSPKNHNRQYYCLKG